MRKRNKLTLMPMIALAALSLTVSLPTLSGMRLYAASAQRYTNVTVQSGQTLWSIAAAHTDASADVQETIDRITEANKLSVATIQPGQHLRIPQ